MCGIVAVWSPGGGVVGEDLRPIEALHHRGPDATGQWLCPSGRAGLAQARLAVVGVRNGRQPVHSDSGDVQAVVNGELYGYREQRRALAARGHRLLTDTDSEIVPHLYADDPDGFVHHLRGEFAVVLWDRRRRRLIAVRDRFGIKPLYYSWIGPRLVLASEVKALFAAGAPRRWDRRSFHDYLHACFPPDRTLFDGVWQVPPGSVLSAGDDGVHITPYWDLDYPTTAQPPAAPGSAAIGDAVEEAVRLRLVADVPVGFHLSGGLDSSSVVGAAAGHAPLRTFTVAFPGDERDESPVARRTADALGAEHAEVVIDPGTRDAVVGQTIAAGEMLQENDHGTARLLLSTAIAEAGLRVALAGEGGDELFAGYQHFRTDAELSVSPLRMARAARSYQALTAGGDAPATLTGTLDRLGFLPGWLIERSLNAGMPSRPLLRADLRDEFATRDSLAELIDGNQEQLRGRPPVHQSMYLFLKTWFCNYILAAERLDMARSVEVRLPLLDHRLFELVRQLPVETMLAGESKQPLRDAMRAHLTDEVLKGEKRPFFAPPPADAGRVATRLRERVGDGALDGNPLLDPPAVDTFLRRLALSRHPLTATQDRMLHLVGSVVTLQLAYGLG
jgi:asparagine synthase (glutamine-hydrolysing)